GVDSPALAALLVEHWEVEATIDPLTATYFGDHSFDAELPPVRRADLLAVRARRDALIERFAALDPAALSARDQVTRGVVVERLEADVLPHARGVNGLAGLPDGAACYAAEIRRHTTEPLTAAELHILGMSEIARIEAAMIALGQELYGVDTLPAIQAQLAAD